MIQKDKIRRREEAAKFWDSHDVTAENSEEITEEIQVRKPLSAMISLRLSDDDLSKLKLVARAQGVGVTTMARMLLHQCLENPGSQLMLQALQTKEVQEGLTEILEDAKVPPGEADPEFLVLSPRTVKGASRTDQQRGYSVNPPTPIRRAQGTVGVRYSKRRGTVRQASRVERSQQIATRNPYADHSSLWLMEISDYD
jgi:predicted DNA binding CopG/RHH family protein